MENNVENKILHALEEFSADLEAGIDPAQKYVVRKASLPKKSHGCDVKNLRKTLGVGPKKFADFLGVPLQALQSWEKGTSRPSRLARRFLEEIGRDPQIFRARLGTA